VPNIPSKSPGLVDENKKFLNNGNDSKQPYLYVSVGMLITHGKHVHDHIISPRGEVWAHSTILSSSLFIKPRRSVWASIFPRLFLRYSVVFLNWTNGGVAFTFIF
jgi:hypothetical protein